jgi:(S)-sulfolactate dehydrogenase
MKIIIPETMHERAVESLRQKFDTLYDPSLVEQPGKFISLVRDVDALIVRKGTQVNQTLLDAAPRLRVVGRLGVGLDNFDLAACKARNVVVIPATDTVTQSVAEHVIAAAMLLLRPSFLTTQETAAGTWPRRARFKDRELAGNTLGVIGFGKIGQRTARLAGCLGVRVIIAHDPLVPAEASVWRELNVGRRGLEDLLAESDIVSLHVPLLETTKNLISRERIAMMKRGAVLINAARGGLVDEHALVDSLRFGHLRGAHLDVFAEEPVGPESIFENVPNLILTPHVAGITEDSEIRTGEFIATKVAQFLEQSL